MPIETPHPQYAENIERWQRCRDAYDGEDAVKARGMVYLPKVDPSQKTAAYDSYLKRASYYEVVGRTVDSLVGAISRKPHVIKLPPGIEVFLSSATADGTGLDEFIKKLSAETSIQGRGGVVVDWDDDKQRSYLALYCAESITNWTDGSVVLHETIFGPDPDDQYRQVAIEQYRQLHMVDGIYTVTIWRKTNLVGVTGQFAVHSVTVPTKRGEPWRILPWFWFSALGQSAEIAKPPMLGLVNESFAHYRSAADLAHGRHFTAIPTLYVTGIDKEEKILVGAGAVIKLEDPQARVGYAEFKGEGLGSLERALSTSETRMAMLGAAAFSSGKKGVEGAEVARLRAAGENSISMGVVSAVEETLTAAMTVAAEWMSAAGEITIKINRDFIDQQLNPQTILGLVSAYQQGLLTIEMFLFCLDQAEMLPPGTDLAVAAAKLLADGPPQPALTKLPAAAPPANPGGEKHGTESDD